MYDTHCHLTFKDYAGRIDAVLADAAAAGVRGCITVATTASSARQCLDLAEAHENVWCTSGVHPLYADEPEDWLAIRDVAGSERCVAWGELGLDNHYDRPPKAVQHRVLETQLGRIELWRDEGLVMPVVVHCRKAVEELLEIFRRSALPADRFVFHCFTGTEEEARRILDFGAWISFTGVVTFRNAPEVAEAATLVPDDRIMVETDAPFLSPEPVRSMRPNEPKNVVHVARFIAELRGVDAGEFERRLDDNAERFFGITSDEATKRRSDEGS